MVFTTPSPQKAALRSMCFMASLVVSRSSRMHSSVLPFHCHIISAGAKQNQGSNWSHSDLGSSETEQMRAAHPGLGWGWGGRGGLQEAECTRP